jgi:hypothetical protein
LLRRDGGRYRLHEDVGEAAVVPRFSRDRSSSLQQRFGFLRPTGHHGDFDERRERVELFARHARFIEALQSAARERFGARITSERDLEPRLRAIRDAQPMRIDVLDRERSKVGYGPPFRIPIVARMEHCDPPTQALAARCGVVREHVESIEVACLFCAPAELRVRRFAQQQERDTLVDVVATIERRRREAGRFVVGEDRARGACGARVPAAGSCLIVSRGVMARDLGRHCLELAVMEAFERAGDPSVTRRALRGRQ